MEEQQPSSTPAARPALPDHLSVDPRSPHFNREACEHDIGIRLNGKERHDVEEYCISEGWVKVPAGKTVDRRGKPVLIKLKGTVEAYYVDAPSDAGQEPVIPAQAGVQEVPRPPR